MMLDAELMTIEEIMEMYFHGFRFTINDGLIMQIKQELD